MQLKKNTKQKTNPEKNQKQSQISCCVFFVLFSLLGGYPGVWDVPVPSIAVSRMGWKGGLCPNPLLIQGKACGITSLSPWVWREGRNPGGWDAPPRVLWGGGDPRSPRASFITLLFHYNTFLPLVPSPCCLAVCAAVSNPPSFIHDFTVLL